MADERSGGGRRAQRVRWDEAHARRAHANECNVSKTPEEFILAFGVSQASPAEDREELVITESHRIIVMPQVAKRLAVLLDRLLREHASRYGSVGRPAPPPR